MAWAAFPWGTAVLLRPVGAGRAIKAPAHTARTCMGWRAQNEVLGGGPHTKGPAGFSHGAFGSNRDAFGRSVSGAGQGPERVASYKDP